MTKKTRVRIARIAAGAVIAAGASLTVAGVASADSNEGGLSGLVETLDGEPEAPGPLDCTIVVTPECESGGGENAGGENAGGENAGGENAGGENAG
ncbi:hypothetical protein ACKI10_43870, partial [Streptomyces galilaeus]